MGLLEAAPEPRPEAQAQDFTNTKVYRNTKRDFTNAKINRNTSRSLGANTKANVNTKTWDGGPPIGLRLRACPG
eukprot:4200114-Alexandrium_andersonii.AAC.1